MTTSSQSTLILLFREKGSSKNLFLLRQGSESQNGIQCVVVSVLILKTNGVNTRSQVLIKIENPPHPTSVSPTHKKDKQVNKLTNQN